jgi:hypothetical protein
LAAVHQLFVCRSLLTHRLSASTKDAGACCAASCAVAPAAGSGIVSGITREWRVDVTSAASGTEGKRSLDAETGNMSSAGTGSTAASHAAIQAIQA